VKSQISSGRPAHLGSLVAYFAAHGPDDQGRTGMWRQQQSDLPHGVTRTPALTMQPQSAQPISMETW
jgi:hypothetical protein